MLAPLVSSKVGEVEKETIGTMTGEKIFQFTDVMCSLSLQDGFHYACFWALRIISGAWERTLKRIDA